MMKWAIGIVLIGLGLAAFVFMADYMVANVFFMTLSKPMPTYSPGLSLQLWNTYGLDATYNKRLLKIVGVFGFIAIAGAAASLVLLRKSSLLHGAARFATYGEIRDADLLASKGILFGDMKRKYLCVGGQRHLFVVAPTRSGKTVGIAIPNLLNWADSALVLDIKLELFEKTSGFRASHGQEVWLFNPFATDYRTHRWNALDAVRKGDHRPGVFTVQDLMAIAGVLYPTADESNSTSKFFNAQAQNLFVGLALLVLETRGLPFTIPQILRTSAGSVDGGLPAYLQHTLETRPELSQPCRDSLMQFCGTGGDTQSGIKASFDAPLLVFRNSVVEAATSGSDFKLSDLRRKRMTIYLGVGPKNMAAGATLMTLFVSQALDANLDALPEHDATLKHQVLFLLDEFRVLGKMQQLVDAAGYLAGYGVRLCTIIQSMGQLQIYGKETGQAFVTNHGIKVVYAPREESDAKEISDALGTFTEMSDSYSRNGSGGKFMKESSGMSTGTSTSAQRRALMLPQEVKLLPEDEEIAFAEGIRPIRAKKIFYYKDPAFLSRLLAPVVPPRMEIDERALFAQAQQPANPNPTPATRTQTNAAIELNSIEPVGAAGSAAAAGGNVIDPDYFDQTLSKISIVSEDRNNPSDAEVAQFVSEFTKAIEQDGVWKF